MSSRNRIVQGQFVLEKIDTATQVLNFDCGDADLNDYFNNDSVAYKKELMTQTYALYEVEDETKRIWALVDFCNDSLSRKVMEKKEQRRIPFSKRGYRTFPGVKITRLGIDAMSHGMKIGTKLLDIIKEFFTTDNRSGCRFITVDAYREAVPFYEKNGFIIAKTIEDEEDRRASTVAMFFDLKRIAK